MSRGELEVVMRSFIFGLLRKFATDCWPARLLVMKKDLKEIFEVCQEGCAALVGSCGIEGGMFT